MECIERRVKAHAERNRTQPLSANAHERNREERPRTVEHACRGVSRWLGSVEEAYGRQRVQPTLTHQEPQVVVCIDQDTSRPQTDNASAGPWLQERGAGGGERDVVSDSHDDGLLSSRWSLPRP
jgi:hypothetical protein